jgi:hypothetical protein
MRIVSWNLGYAFSFGVATIRRGTTWRLSIQTSPFSRRLFHRLGPENGGRSRS